MAENTEEILDEEMNNPGKDEEVKADACCGDDKPEADMADAGEALTETEASDSDSVSEEAPDSDAKDAKSESKKGRKDKKLEALESKNAELEDRVKRQMAEFENFRKRTAQCSRWEQEALLRNSFRL